MSRNVKKLTKSCQKFRHTWKKPNKNNCAIVEKVQLCKNKKSDKIVRKGCQKVVKKLSKVFKKLFKSCQKIVKN
jgi:hypothetical protein